MLTLKQDQLLREIHRNQAHSTTKQPTPTSPPKTIPNNLASSTHGLNEHPVNAADEGHGQQEHEHQGEGALEHGLGQEIQG